MDDLFQKRMAILGNTGDKVLQESNQIMDKTFLNDRNCKYDKLYDQNLNYLDTVYYKFQRSTNYTINKDQVEYYIQFKPTDYDNFSEELEEKIVSILGNGYYDDISKHSDNSKEEVWLNFSSEDIAYKKLIGELLTQEEYDALVENNADVILFY